VCLFGGFVCTVATVEPALLMKSTTKVAVSTTACKQKRERERERYSVLEFLIRGKDLTVASTS
jgi:hypothetical protein